MADPTITSVEVQDGVLHIHGSNFTQTTTTVFVDDVTVNHSFVSASELTVDPAPAAGAEVVVEKGGVQTEPVAVGAAEPGSSETPPDPVEPAATVEPAASVATGGAAGNTGPVPIAADDLKTEQEKGPADPVSPAVDPGSKAETMEKLGIGPRDPYPTGNPPDPEEAFYQAHGYRRAPPETNPAPPPPAEPEKVP